MAVLHGEIAFPDKHEADLGNLQDLLDIVECDVFPIMTSM